jgi:hypothetical protein
VKQADEGKLDQQPRTTRTTMASSTRSIIGTKKSVKQGLKRLQFLFEKKHMENKLAFWLPLRADFIMMKSFDKKLDYGDQVFDREQLERALAMQYSRVEIRRVERSRRISVVNEESSSSEDNDDEEVKESRIMDPVKFMERNLGNISCIP